MMVEQSAVLHSVPSASAGGGDNAGFPQNSRCCLTVSVVTYRPKREELEKTIASLERSVAQLGTCSTRLFLIDNNPDDADRDWLAGLAGHHGGVLVAGHGNIGFGRAHNLVLAEVGRFHLVLNPDVELATESLERALKFMEAHPDCGLLSPAAHWATGERQYLCKRIPTVLDLFLRGFAPFVVRRWFDKRLSAYEMRQHDFASVMWDPPIVSGCFMLFRGNIFRKAGGFDPRYFLYFEDFDLSLRAGKLARIAYVPSVRILHHGGHAARKGLAHVRMFGLSALTFFGTHGWRWW